jgi:hypothetical protein
MRYYWIRTLEWLAPIFMVAFIGYSALFLFFTPVYMFDFILNGRGCSGQYRRVEYVFPARPLGCWLGEVPK